MNKQLPMANPEIRSVSESLEAADPASTFFARIEAFGRGHAIERYAKECPLNRVVAHEHFTELKNFLAIHAASNERIGMAGPVDAAWDPFCCPRESIRASPRLLGRFVYHVPDIDHDGSAESFTSSTSLLQI